MRGYRRNHPGHRDFGHHQRARLTQHRPGRAELNRRAHAENPHRQNRYGAGDHAIREGAKVLPGPR